MQKQKVQEQKVQEQKVRKQKASRRKCSIPKLRFFISFIPQFVHRSAGHAFLQFVLLGTVSVVLNTSVDLIVILMAGPLGKKIQSSSVFRRRQRTVTGAIMIGLGTYLSTSESK